MPNTLKTRLIIAGVVLLVVLIGSLLFGFDRTVRFVAGLFGVRVAETRHEEDDRKKPDPTPPDKTPPDRTPAEPGTYLFCFWNVENLFDDSEDGRKSKGDPEYDRWFATDKEALTAKLDHLCDVLVPLNGGRGPDILGVCEVESKRAAQLLADALNKRLSKDLAYTTVVAGRPPTGTFARHIQPALITRLPVEGEPETWGSNQRLLKAVVRVNGNALNVVVSHWTSHVSDKTGDKRAIYAKIIHEKYEKAFADDPKIDYLVCGDFNDNPNDDSVKTHLHATGKLDAVKASREPPLLFDLFAKFYPDVGATHYHNSTKYVFDHICVSPGLFDDKGWSCDPDTATIVTSFADRKGHPNKFGNRSDKRPLSARGASDHFPVTVRLRVR